MCSFLFFFLFIAITLCGVQGCSSDVVTNDCRSWGMCSCGNKNVCTDKWGQKCGKRQKCHYTYSRRQLLARRILRRGGSGGSRSSSRSSSKSKSYKSSYKSPYKSYKSYKYTPTLKQVCVNEDYCERAVVGQDCEWKLVCVRKECSNWCCKPDREVCASSALDDLSFYDFMQKRNYNLSAACPAVTAPAYRTWKNRKTNHDGQLIFMRQQL